MDFSQILQIQIYKMKENIQIINEIDTFHLQFE
jgi:hypothetical protein